MFSEEDIEDLPDDVPEAGLSICKKIFAHIGGKSAKKPNKAQLLAAYDFLNAFLESVGMQPGEKIKRNGGPVYIRNMVAPFLEKMHRHFQDIIDERQADQQRLQLVRVFDDKFKRAFAYEFSDGDVRIIQCKINELRDLINNSKYMDDEFRLRLLKRLERLQAEFHKRISDLDRFWGLLGDAGVAVGKFGSDAKPIFDRVRELLETVWRTQARAEELPTNSPLPELGQEEC